MRGMSYHPIGRVARTGKQSFRGSSGFGGRLGTNPHNLSRMSKPVRQEAAPPSSEEEPKSFPGAIEKRTTKFEGFPFSEASAPKRGPRTAGFPVCHNVSLEERIPTCPLSFSVIRTPTPTASFPPSSARTSTRSAVSTSRPPLRANPLPKRASSSSASASRLPKS